MKYLQKMDRTDSILKNRISLMRDVDDFFFRWKGADLFI